jgi:hypothetical protein
MNAQQEIAEIGYWLLRQNRRLAIGLRNAEDALKLHRYWQQHSDILPPRCDDDVQGIDVSSHRILAVGYDPMEVYCGY